MLTSFSIRYSHGMNTISSPQAHPRYDLTERTHVFAQKVCDFLKLLPRTMANIEDMKQLVRSSGSVAANYIEADEALSRKDFIMRLRISRKEAKESIHWLRLLDTGGNTLNDHTRLKLIAEAKELLLIFSASIRTVTNRSNQSVLEH